MPDLGEYAGPVLAAYGVSILLLVGLAVFTVRRARKLRDLLDRVERGEDG
jgi:heme exporter protein D